MGVRGGGQCPKENVTLILIRAQWEHCATVILAKNACGRMFSFVKLNFNVSLFLAIAYIKPQFWEWKFNFAKESMCPKSKFCFLRFSLSPTIDVLPFLPPHFSYNGLRNNCVITFSKQEIWFIARGGESPRKAWWTDKYYISVCVITRFLSALMRNMYWPQPLVLNHSFSIKNPTVQQMRDWLLSDPSPIIDYACH